MEPFLFRTIAANEIDIVHAIYNEAFDWLKAKGVRQWLIRKPRSYFEGFRRQGQLYGLFDGNELAIFAALVPEKEPHWAGETDITDGAWIHRLTLNPRFRGRQIGALMVGRLIALAHENGASHICVDAVDVNDIMPAYYENLGFQRRTARYVTYPNGNTFPVVFLDIKLTDPDPAPELQLRCHGYEEPEF